MPTNEGKCQEVCFPVSFGKTLKIKKSITHRKRPLVLQEIVENVGDRSLHQPYGMLTVLPRCWEPAGSHNSP